MNQAFAKKYIVYVSDTEVECTKCGRTVLYEDLPYIRSIADGMRLSYCMKCRYKQVKTAMEASPEKFFRDRERRLQQRLLNSKRKMDHDRGYGLRTGYLLALWNAQNRLCFYTDQSLHLGSTGRGPDNITVDRVDNLRGYYEDNVVLTTRRINGMKSDLNLNEVKLFLPSWYQRIETNLISLHGMAVRGTE